MRRFLLAAACLALASCSATKSLPQYSEAEKAAQRGGISYWQPTPPPATDTGAHFHRQPVWTPADSAIYAKVPRVGPEPVATEKSGILARLFGKGSTSPPAPLSAKEGVPRKCKGCTFNVVAGNQTVAGKKATVAAGDGAAVVIAAKEAGPAVLADSGAHVGVVGSGIAQAGDGNTATMPAPVPELSAWAKWKAGVASVWATAKGPLIGLGVIAAVVAGIHFFAPASAAALWLAGLVRRKKPAENQT